MHLASAFLTGAAPTANPFGHEQGLEALGTLIVTIFFGYCIYFTRHAGSGDDAQLKTSPLAVISAVSFAAMPLTIWLIHWYFEIC